MAVHIDEPRQQKLAFGVDEGRVAWNPDGTTPSCRLNAVALDNGDGIFHGDRSSAVDEAGTHNRDRILRGRETGVQERSQAEEKDVSSHPSTGMVREERCGVTIHELNRVIG